jgi:hypothetical protein
VRRRSRARHFIAYLSFCGVISSSTAFAAPSLYLSQNARTFDTEQSSLIIKGLAHACLTIINIPDSLPCNPSLLPFEKKPRLNVQAAISNGYSTLERMRKLLAGKLTDDLVRDLFSKDRVLQIEGNGEIDFISPYFSARYMPANIKYFSVVRNEADPDVELSAVEEQNFMLQFGYKFGDVITVGLEAKSFARKFIKQRFMLVDLATDAGKAALKPKKENGFAVAPAATLFLPGDWQPRIALKIANLQTTNGDTEGVEEPVDVQTGFGITIPLGWSSLDFALDYRSLSYNEEWSEKFHLSSMFRFGAMSLVGGADYFGFSGGVFYGLEQVNAGILFSTTQAPWNSNDYYADTVYLQIGWQI